MKQMKVNKTLKALSLLTLLGLGILLGGSSTTPTNQETDLDSQRTRPKSTCKYRPATMTGTNSDDVITE